MIASAREQDVERCRRSGADLVVDFRDPAPAGRMRCAARAGVGVYWDRSGHHDLDVASAILALRGRILLAAAARARPELPVRITYTGNHALLGFAISNATIDDLASAPDVGNRRLAAGTFTTRIGDVLPLAQAGEAHRRVERGNGTRLIPRP